MIKYSLLDLFIDEFEAAHMDVQMTIMTKLNKKMFQFTFRGEAELIRQWLAEVGGEIVFIEVRRLYDITTVMSFGVPHNGEIHKFERNSLELEIEHLGYTDDVR